MLHLFNKVYLEIDDKINLELDRVVISQENGVPVSIELERVTAGQLIAYGRTFEEVASDFPALMNLLKTTGNQTGKKIVIYADRDAYKSVLSTWLKSMLPNLDIASFKTIVDHMIYKERVMANTSLSSSYTLSMQTIWKDFGDFETQWRAARAQPVDFTGMNLSYEFLIADYLSGSTKYEDALRATMHKFLVRWYRELFTDNRQMCLINLTNSRFQSDLGIDPATIDITATNPLANIPVLAYYADETIWGAPEDATANAYGYITLEGISTEQAEGLRNTILYVYSKFEGMLIDTWVFRALDWVDVGTRTSMTKAEMDAILDFVVNTPFDTCLVPRFDFENVNFPLFLYFLAQKKNNKDLTTYRLI